jgi:hypothetical protein
MYLVHQRKENTVKFLEPTSVSKILSGHVSPETAYLVEDYPYGFRLRCQIRYWLEYSPKHGCRFMSQTTNPKRPGLVWNKPKGSTYSRFGACMVLGEDGHVAWTGLGEYTDGAQALAWSDRYGEGVPETAKPLLAKWVAAKLAYEAKKAAGEPAGLPFLT